MEIGERTDALGADLKAQHAAALGMFCDVQTLASHINFQNAFRPIQTPKVVHLTGVCRRSE